MQGLYVESVMLPLPLLPAVLPSVRPEGRMEKQNLPTPLAASGREEPWARLLR